MKLYRLTANVRACLRMRSVLGQYHVGNLLTCGFYHSHIDTLNTHGYRTERLHNEISGVRRDSIFRQIDRGDVIRVKNLEKSCVGKTMRKR